MIALVSYLLLLLWQRLPHKEFSATQKLPSEIILQLNEKFKCVQKETGSIVF